MQYNPEDALYDTYAKSNTTVSIKVLLYLWLLKLLEIMMLEQQQNGKSVIGLMYSSGMVYHSVN